MFKAYLIFAAISLLLVYGFIRFLLNPLKRIRAQALAISEHRFLIEHKIPKLPELRQVTLAMNQMSSMIKSLFQDQLHQINTLRGEVYQDPLTGLSNRRYFMQQLSSLLEHQDEFIPGFIVMIVIDGLNELNVRQGFQQGDKLIITIAQVCREFWQSKVNIIARINGSTIAFISHEANHEAFVEDCKKFEQALREVLGDSKCKIHIGATDYFLHQSSSNLLTMADSAVKKAREQGVFYCESNKEQLPNLPVIGLKEINQALKEKSIHLMTQAVIGENKVLHNELFPRLNDSQGNVFGAGFFMPLAEQLKVAHLIDLYVLNEVANKKLSAKSSFALNLSEDTLTHIQHSEHYLQQLHKMSKADLKNISLEIKESLVLSHFVEVKDFILQAKKYGVKIGIDRVGIHFSPLYYLNDLPVNYLKLDGSLIKDIEENKSKQFFIYYFNKMAKTMNIQVVATQVENKMQWEALKMAHIPWGQGKYLAEVVNLV